MYLRDRKVHFSEVPEHNNKAPNINIHHPKYADRIDPIDDYRYLLNSKVRILNGGQQTVH